MGKKEETESKGRKKKQSTEASPAEVTPAGVDASGAAAPVDAVIDLDDDLDDPLARAELVAAVAGLEAVPEAEDEPEDSAESFSDGSEDQPDGPAVSADEVASAEPVSDIEGAGEPDTDAAYGVPTDQEESERPLIGPDALEALSELRREGVATLPEELILDLGGASTPEERDRVLAAALAHVEMQEAIYRVPLESGASRRWKGIIATAVFLFALILFGLPPAFLVPDAPPPLTAGETAHGIRMAILLQAEQIEAFRARSGRLPTSIAEVETALPGVRFVRSSNRLYQLIAYTPAGDAVVYDSSSPDASFGAAEEAWSRLMGDS